MIPPTPAMHIRRPGINDLLSTLAAAAVLIGLYLASHYSYLLFHTASELASIALAGAIFVLTWNFRHFYKDSFLTFIGVAYLFSGFIDLLHTLAYKGMGVFVGYDTNLPTQLWIAARYVQSVSLLAAPLFLKRKISTTWLLGGFSLVTTLLLLSIFTWKIFPVSYIEGIGLTSFKIGSEYFIDLLLAAAILALLRQRRFLDRVVLQWMILAIGVTILSELAFTLYFDVYGHTNLLGHYGKIIAYYLVYKAVIETQASKIYADMIQLREAESALRASERNLKLFIEYSPAAIAMFDLEMRFLLASRRYLTDYQIVEQEIIGRSFVEIFPTLAERWQETFRRCLAGAVEKCDEDPFLAEDGSTVWIRWEMRPWYISQAETGGVILFSEVITERKRMSEALAQANDALHLSAERLKISNHELEQFAFVASHDLQEPLRKVKMFGDRLKEHLDNAPPGVIGADAVDDLRRMQSAAERMQAMIIGLLELSRVSTRGGVFAPVHLTLVVEEVANDLEALVHESGGQITVEELYSAEVDVNQIRRLFINLLGNALKFHKPGVPPEIRVSAAHNGSSLTLTVKDNGIGFDEKYAERIFQPFQRLHGRSQYEGSGLGLSICQKIVSRHHGKIEAHSQPGQGAEFRITLPVEQAENRLTKDQASAGP